MFVSFFIFLEVGCGCETSRLLSYTRLEGVHSGILNAECVLESRAESSTLKRCMALRGPTHKVTDGSDSEFCVVDKHSHSAEGVR